MSKADAREFNDELHPAPQTFEEFLQWLLDLASDIEPSRQTEFFQRAFEIVEGASRRPH